MNIADIIWFNPSMSAFRIRVTNLGLSLSRAVVKFLEEHDMAYINVGVDSSKGALAISKGTYFRCARLPGKYGRINSKGLSRWLAKKGFPPGTTLYGFHKDGMLIFEAEGGVHNG